MGKADKLLKAYFQDREIFADAVNLFLLDKSDSFRVDPAQLREMNTNLVSLPYGIDSKTEIERFRDLLNAAVSMTDGRKAYLILGIENQDEVHLAMPIRNMLSDAMQYSSQVQAITRSYRAEQKKTTGKNKKKSKKKSQKREGKLFHTSGEFLSGLREGDKVLPVLTLVMYYGSDRWGAPRSLHEMIQWPETGFDMKPYIPDYRLNLIEPCSLGKESFAEMKTELRLVLEYVKHSSDKQQLLKLIDEDDAYKKVERRTADVMNVLTGSDIPYEETDEVVDVCKAIRDMLDDAVNDAVREKEVIIEEKDSLLHEKETEIQEKNTEVQRLQARLLDSLQKMKSDGFSMQQMTRYTGLTETEVAALIS